MWSMLKEDVRVAFERDPAARNLFEVLVSYPGCTRCCSIASPTGCGTAAGETSRVL